MLRMTRSTLGIRLWLAAALVTAVAGVQPARARQAALPDARAIFDRHVQAIGGAAAFARIQSIHARGRLDIAAQGISGDVEILSARPARLVYRATVAGIGEIARGYDGHVAWSVSPISGPEVLTGRMLAQTADDAWFDRTLYESDRLREATTVEKTTFDNRPAFKVHVISISGDEEMDYFDADTGLEIGSETTEIEPQGPIPTVNILRNYQRFGAVLQPTVFVQRALGLEQVVTLTSVEYNTVPDSAFDLPAAIKALVKS